MLYDSDLALIASRTVRPERSGRLRARVAPTPWCFASNGERARLRMEEYFRTRTWQDGISQSRTGRTQAEQVEEGGRDEIRRVLWPEDGRTSWAGKVTRAAPVRAPSRWQVTRNRGRARPQRAGPCFRANRRVLLGVQGRCGSHRCARGCSCVRVCVLLMRDGGDCPRVRV